MEQIYEQELFITPSLADARGRLSWPGAFTVCQDLAGIHAERLGVGLGAMAEKSLFWLTVRTKIRILDFPRLGETVTARTWPEKPGALRCNRSYEIVRDGENGFLCENTADSLAAVMEKALADPALCEKLGKNARETLPTPWDEVMDRGSFRRTCPLTGAPPCPSPLPASPTALRTRSPLPSTGCAPRISTWAGT